jgi:hypothetical protein
VHPCVRGNTGTGGARFGLNDPNGDIDSRACARPNDNRERCPGPFEVAKKPHSRNLEALRRDVARSA